MGLLAGLCCAWGGLTAGSDRREQAPTKSKLPPTIIVAIPVGPIALQIAALNDETFILRVLPKIAISSMGP